MDYAFDAPRHGSLAAQQHLPAMMLRSDSRKDRGHLNVIATDPAQPRPRALVKKSGPKHRLRDGPIAGVHTLFSRSNNSISNTIGINHTQIVCVAVVGNGDDRQKRKLSIISLLPILRVAGA